MNRISFTLGFASFCVCLATILHAVEKPNIVIILVDDMGYSDIGCYGGEIETPNLDQLAENGLRFTQFYNSGRCCPTRASLMTGLQPHQVGIGHMTHPPKQPLGFEGAYQGYLNQNCVTLAQVLKSAGYHTIMTGKWHLGMQNRSEWPLQRGFDDFYGGLSGAFNYMRPGGDRTMTRGNEPVETDEDFYTTDTFTDEAIEYLSRVPEDKPFFLYLAHNAPHWPLQPKVKDFEKYRGQYKDGWQAVMDSRLKKQIEIGLFSKDVVAAPHEGPSWESLNDKQRDNLDKIQAAYAGCVDCIDQNVGKLVAHLKETDRFDNTLIFFLSDNGACQEGGNLGRIQDGWIENPPLDNVDGIRQGKAWAIASNTPYRLYKHFVHEGGACTPMIAHWPNGIAKKSRGTFCRQVAYLPDFMATCLELSGAEYPKEIPACVGKSMASLLAGNENPIHSEHLFWEHEGNAAVRWQNWKLVRQYKKPWELYSMLDDPTEMNDLSTKRPGLRRELIELWEKWAAENDVAYPERFNMYQYLNQRKKGAK